MIKLLRVDSAEEGGLYKQRGALRQQIGIPPDYDELLRHTRSRPLLLSGEKRPFNRGLSKVTGGGSIS